MDIHEILSQLQSPIPDLQTLLRLLAGPLETIGLLPPKYRRHLNEGSASSLSIKKHIPQIQRHILTYVLPTWDNLLLSNDSMPLLEQYFCPDVFSSSLPATGSVVLSAYGTLLSVTPLSSYAIKFLERLSSAYPIDRLHQSVFNATDGMDKAIRGLDWEDCVRNVCMVPGKVSNAMAADTNSSLPLALENATYFNSLSGRTEELILRLSSNSKSSDALSSLTYLLQKLVNVGLFPSRPPIARSQPTFFVSTLPRIRSRISSTEQPHYTSFWAAILQNLPALTLQSILASLFGSLSLSTIDSSLDDTPPARALIKREAFTLHGIVGKLTQDKAELWEIATSLILTRNWAASYARVFVCWVSGGAKGAPVDLKALDIFLEAVLDMWASSEHIKHSLISKHQYTTLLLLLTISYLPPSSKSLESLLSNAAFIRGISTYIAHLDVSVRRCGMLAAEVVAQLTGKKLEFGDWEGDEGITPWARQVRKLLKGRDVDAPLDRLDDEVENSQKEDVAVEEISTPAASVSNDDAAQKLKLGGRATLVANPSGYDSDDSLTGYASTPPSSRSASPTPSDLAEIEKDPTLNVGVTKVPRPVYLAQLGELVRGTGTQGKKPGEPHEVDKIEMALGCAEELIRKKQGYGSELDENAVNLAYAFLSLNDNYDLEGFSEKRQGAMNALIACAPRKAAPALIEEFFKNQYSADQRFVVLNALAIGARELASLPVPLSSVPPERTAFPSKTLPGPLHKKYITAGQANTDLVPLLMDEISKNALTNEQKAADTHPELIRERRLRLQKPAKIEVQVAQSHPLNPYSRLETPLKRQSTKFIDVAAEFFIVPLINRFWSFLRDEQAREERTSFREGSGGYYGAGTGLVLNPLVLAQFLRTIAILVHASQNASEWMAIIAHDSLELSVTIGTRPVSRTDLEDDEKQQVNEEERQKKEASVLTSALELALVVLDGALEIDGGRILGLEHTTLVLGVGEWAGKVFASIEKGLRVQGGGGLHEAKLNRAAAGVCLKVEELTSKWRRSMLDMR